MKTKINETIINAILWWGGIIAHSVWYTRTYDVHGWEIVTDFSLRWVLTFLPVVACIAVGQFLSIRIYRRFLKFGIESLDNGDIKEVLQGFADEVNKTCPQILDEQTRLNRAVAGPGRKFTYMYTITGVEQLDKNDFINAMRPNLLENSQYSDEMESFRQMGAEIKWVYSQENGDEFAHITISPDEFSK